jgi:hypothetical protein
LVNSGVGWVFDFAQNHWFLVLVINQIFRTIKPSAPDLSCPALLPPKEKKRSESKNRWFWLFKPRETASFHERTDRELTVIKPVIWVFSNPFENRGYISEAGSLEDFCFRSNDGHEP